MELIVRIEKRLRDFTLAADFTLTDTTLALLGASGSGKSMTLKCIAGLERPDRGQILLNGRTLYDSEKGINLPPQARGVGYLFQNYALFPNMTVHENIIFALDGTREEKERILAENVARFSLEGIENAYPARLSGGQQQRAAFARILARGADLLLLDEPAAGMNPQETLELMEMIRWVKKEFGITILLIEHDMSLVMGICERIYVLEYGAIIANGSPEDIRTNPEVIRAYLGAEE